MSINGMRSPSAAPLPMAPAPGGDTGADVRRAPDSGMEGGAPRVFERLSPRAADTAIQPRIALAKLGTACPEQGVSSPAEIAQVIAASVCSEVDSGKVVLLGLYSPSVRSAAAETAALRLMALQKDFFARS